MFRLFIVVAFVWGGAITYSAAHWLAWSDPAYTRVFSSPFRSAALFARIIDREGVRWPLGFGLLLGICVVAVDSRHWLFLSVALLIAVVGAMILQSLL
jgi:hypothetical protein